MRGVLSFEAVHESVIYIWEEIFFSNFSYKG